MSDLTPSQKKLMVTLVSMLNEYGYSPSVREIAERLGIKAPSVHEQLKKLERKGFIRREKNKARTIEILKNPQSFQNSFDSDDVEEIPVFGEVAAGIPVLAEENKDGTVSVSRSFLRKNGRYFALKVRGDSMIDSGIKPGCHIVIKRQSAALPGDIIVALLGDEATVKRFAITDEGVFLYPENSFYSPIDVTYREDFKVLGKVITWL